MTAKELIKELQEILSEHEGKDFSLLVWTGVGKHEIHGIEFSQLVEIENDPKADYIALQTTKSCRDLNLIQAGLRLELEVNLGRN
jgi:hypothetical protein